MQTIANAHTRARARARAEGRSSEKFSGSPPLERTGRGRGEEERKGVRSIRLEKQREWQTKDHELGTLCPLELIRKRDFEIVMILCLRRFSTGESDSPGWRSGGGGEGGGRGERGSARPRDEDTRGASRRQRRLGSRDGCRLRRGSAESSNVMGGLRRNIPSKTFHSTRE